LKTCSEKSVVAGQDFIEGDAYLDTTFPYYESHLWRFFGILCILFFALLFMYIVSSEYIRAKPSRGEILVFHAAKSQHLPKVVRKDGPEAAVMPEKSAVAGKAQDRTAVIVHQAPIFHWDDVCYGIKIKGTPRRIVGCVHSRVKPGTLTALMGVTGAGNISLLDL
jgi:ATP-binding cassette subfamily G (WHITE) protein 2 (PDR)